MCGSLRLQLACLGSGAVTALALPDLLDDYTHRYYAGLGASVILGALLSWDTGRGVAALVHGGFWGLTGWHVARHLCRNGLA